MRDRRKFCRPKTTNYPQVGDVLVKLKCGTKVYVKIKEYLKVKDYFKVNSVFGETTNSAGNIKVLDKDLNKEIVITSQDYLNNLDKFELTGIVNERYASESPLAQEGDVIVHSNDLNRDAIFSFTDWLSLSDDWDLKGLYGITTYEEEDASNGDYVILANGNTLIIKPADYSKVSSHWELVDTIIVSRDYIEIGGIKWATMNVGANSITDGGLLFQWGDTQGYTADQVGSGSGQKYFGWADYKYNPNGDGETMTKYNESDGKTVLETSDDAVTAAWGGNWRMPTYDEFQALNNAVNTEYTEVDGVYGLLCTDIEDSSKVLFFPTYANAKDGNVDYDNSNASYWSSTLSAYVQNTASVINYNYEGTFNSSDLERNYGFLVRGILDE